MNPIKIYAVCSGQGGIHLDQVVWSADPILAQSVLSKWMRPNRYGKVTNWITEFDIGDNRFYPPPIDQILGDFDLHEEIERRRRSNSNEFRPSLNSIILTDELQWAQQLLGYAPAGWTLDQVRTLTGGIYINDPLDQMWADYQFRIKLLHRCLQECRVDWAIQYTEQVIDTMTAMDPIGLENLSRSDPNDWVSKFGPTFTPETPTKISRKRLHLVGVALVNTAWSATRPYWEGDRVAWDKEREPMMASNTIIVQRSVWHQALQALMVGQNVERWEGDVLIELINTVF